MFGAIKPFLFELLGIEFLTQWPNTGKGAFWYDWMMRDFFAFMLKRQGGFTIMRTSWLCLFAVGLTAAVQPNAGFPGAADRLRP